MGGYIGAKTGTLVASASDIRGDISATDATPEITLKNTTETDADGTRSGKITFKGEQSGGEESVLAQIQGSHDGTADDEKGDLIFKTNDGSDGASPTERLRIDSAGAIIPATLGTDNVHLGEGAGAAISSGGNNNVVIGKDAGTAITTGDRNTAVGHQAGDAVTTGGRNTLMGYKSGSGLIDPDRNVAFGYGSLESDTKGTKSTAIGYSALNTQNFTSATDSHNTAVGYTAGESITTGNNNTIVGSTAGDAMTTCASNTAVGTSALGANQTANSNTAVGKGAGQSTTQAAGTYVGTQAGENTNSVSNTFIGCSAGELVTSGQKNTILGRFNGNESGIDIRTSDNNIVLSDGDGNVRQQMVGTGNIGFGNLASVGDIASSIAFTVTGDGTHDDHYYRFGPHWTGNDPVFYVINKNSVGVYLTDGGQAWIAHSDERIKENITSLGTVLPNIENLRCVKYNLKGQSDTKIGFIAQDWENDFPEVVDEQSRQVIENDGTVSLDDESESTTVVKAIAYTETIPVLLKAIQELSAKNDALETENTAIKARLDALEAE